MRPNLSLVTLGVSDLARSIVFYRDVLGWETTAKPDDGVAFFPLHGIVLGLFPKQELAKDAKITLEDAGHPRFSLAHNAMSKAEVDELFETLRSQDVKILKEPEEVFWGGYSGYFADPDGFVWEIAWNPHWKLDENGIVKL